MILTFLYMIATSIQSRRIVFLKNHLRNLFQGDTTTCPSIMFYNKKQSSNKESNSPMNDCENDEFMTSCLCVNKRDARLEELLWYYDDMRLCTIFPQQKVDISSWLTYQYGKTFFPLHTNNRNGTLLQSEYKLYILVEADLKSYNPIAATHATKVEDYGLIITWTANKNIDLIIESDLDMVAKFLIAAMEGQCYINNGLLLKRIETVLISGKPCLYNSDVLNSPPTKKFIDKEEWTTHAEKLKSLSDTAKLVSEKCKPFEVKDLPGLIVYPENAVTDAELELMKRVESNETLESETRSQVSTPVSVNIPQHENQLSQDEIQKITKDTAEFQGVPHSTSKSLDMLDNLDVSSTINTRQVSCSDIKSTSKSFEPKSFYDAKYSKSIASTSPFKNSIAEITRKLSKNNVRPPNVLIYADSFIARNNVKGVLEESLDTNKYTIYALSPEEARNDAWVENAALVVVCGNVGNEIGNRIVEYILHGGKLLALCSDVIHILLPSFKTAEVRENELVHFSYGKWKHVRMMHHIFCYQASPVRTRFSQDHEDVKVSSVSPPATVSVKDKKGNSHSFDLKVLGTEETWHTPSILLATLLGSGGKLVFSQIHLEVDPMQYELEESKFNALKESNATRLEIFNDLLKTHLEIEVRSTAKLTAHITYTSAFFLGRHELKLEMLERLKDVMTANDSLKMPKLEIQFCRSSTVPRPASALFLPIMIHQCPDNFSTVEYFENLSTKELGRLVIYVDIMTSSMDVFNGHQLGHGLAVIVRQQTQGRGRSKNIWLSPKGAALFTLQLHVPTDTILGRRISILQHLVSVAIISAFKSLSGYEDIDLRLKWPNDIYAGNNVKIGGLIVETHILSDLNICNVGVGINLFNKEPTCCINDIVTTFNEIYQKKLEMISYEQYFAIVFNEIERWLNIVQSGNIDDFLDAYYTYWMHTDTNVTVLSASGVSQNVKILGIDDYGYLRVRGEDGTMFTVHPDGNTFDCLKGLIAPK
ncbi:biotin--protein ligase isoform X1 [Bombus impatiens]|uniref:Biotin--protein ligase isoform X1 n=2 Tax=Bombus impatiens TaxID=132113 RepID=A0A6P3E1F5_BOMIM|nr:biotin--protein ligase isoform X1 [Bombus impatiens]XP_012245805.1 biotin--protein ligase isoform X1 [Bombus impatiens]